MTILVDRCTGVVDGASFLEAIGISLIRLAFTLSRPFGHLGISRINRVLGGIFLRRGSTTFIFDKDTSFTVPSGDYYWSLLYNTDYAYEFELEAALRQFAQIDYDFFDLGANFGYWSVRVSSPSFGSKTVVAVEASREFFERLEHNARQRNHLVATHMGAICPTRSLTSTAAGMQVVRCSTPDPLQVRGR